MKTHRLRLLLVCVPLWVLSSCSKEDANSNAPTAVTRSSNAVDQPYGYSEVSYVDPINYAANIAVTGNAFALTVASPSGSEPAEANGRRVHYRNMNSASNFDPWTYLPSPGAVSIASGGQKAWIVDAQGRIFHNYFGRGVPEGWVQFSANNQPRATAIATDGDETGLFILGDTWITGGHPVYKYDRTSNSWSQVGTQGGIRLHVDVYGRPWIVTNTGEIYRSAGYGQTFSGWNYIQKPAGQVIDITQLRYVNNYDTPE
jgi:hypothetical protein